eukprot:scaffold73814_cov39-Phaeocystis_antarctica.AAC.2
MESSPDKNQALWPARATKYYPTSAVDACHADMRLRSAFCVLRSAFCVLRSAFCVLRLHNTAGIRSRCFPLMKQIYMPLC